MNDIFTNIIEKNDKKFYVNKSNISISSHALIQYGMKCCPKLKLDEIAQKIRKKLVKLEEVQPSAAKAKKHPGTSYYKDDEDIIYVVCNNKLITTYPKKRILNAKPNVRNKKPGWKWL